MKRLFLGALLLLSFSGMLHAYEVPRGAGHPSASMPHWYPYKCCSKQDCEAIPMSAVHETPDGFVVEYISTPFGLVRGFIPHADAQSSNDMDFHACSMPAKRSTDLGSVRCLFIPTMM